MDERRKIVFNKKLYQVNKSTEAYIYYYCSKLASVISLLKTILINWRLHKLLQAQRASPIYFICEKSSRRELYPHQIYESLLLTLRQQFTDMVYDIPSKKYTYARIKEICGSMSVNNIYAITLELMRSLQNVSPFSQRYCCGDIHGDYHQMRIWITDECLFLLRYNGHGRIKIFTKLY
ncbi:hypothetical protein HZS_4164 [Henneguya salminicola]|nr:hypothetical protein HZS_4164 [Henneguya salminicola]